MKKNSFGFVFLTLLAFFSSSHFFAFADDASDMMDAALAQQVETQPSASVVPSKPAVDAPQPPIVADAPENSQPIKARDVLPKEEKELSPVSEAEGVAAKEKVTQDATESGQLMVADFDTGDKPNNLGGDFGAWDKDPSDDTQGCRMSFISDDPNGNPDGFALRLDYDVDSPTPAYNGLYMKLEGANVAPFDVLSFYVHGASNRFTKQFKVELKTADHHSSAYIVNGITADWQEIQIPLKRFTGIKKGSALSELIFVFDDVNTAPKKGTLVLDQISFKRTKTAL